MYRIIIDRNRCIGCLACVAACIIVHESESGDARNKVVIDCETKPAPVFCRHCTYPECVYTCQSGAMKKDSDTGYVVHDPKKCVQCFNCIMSCPYGILKADSVYGKEIMKCNMCTHRAKDKIGSPMCVEKCPMHAISFEEV